MKLQRPSVGSSSAIGLEIGSRAIRAVEVTRGRKGLGLRRGAEIAVPSGAVSDGEIRDVGAVATTLRQLWAEGGFGSRDVVSVLSGQRVIVRQAEVIAMSETDFRSALKYQAAELIPLPVDHTVLDFSILSPVDQPASEPGKMRVLLAAAHRDVVETQVRALREASLVPVGADAAPIAAVRALSLAAPTPGVTAVVRVSDDVALIAVQRAGTVLFSRILSIGESEAPFEATSSVPSALVGGRSSDASGFAETNGFASPDAPRSPAGSYDVNSVVTEVLGSLSFFARQMGGATIDEVVVSGVQDDSLLSELGRRLPYRVTYFDSLAALDLSGAALDSGRVETLGATGLLAVGSAEWAFEPSARRISLLPVEVHQAATARRLGVLCGVGGLVVVVALGGLTWHERSQVNKEKKVAAQLLVGNDSLQGKVAALAPVSAAHSAVTSRVALLKAAEANDIAWSPLLAEIANAMPAGTTLTNISFSDTSGGTSSSGTSASPTATSGSAGSSPVVAGSLGTVSMSVQGSGTEDEVAVWLRSLSKVKGLSAVWVPAGSDSGGKVTFSSSASVTSGVPLVHRDDVITGASS